MGGLTGVFSNRKPQGPGRGSLSDWYREQVEELRAQSAYIEERDRHYELARSRLGTGQSPSQNGHASPWQALKELGFDVQKMVEDERRWRGEAEKEADETKKALFNEQADRLRDQIEALRQEVREGKGSKATSEVNPERPKTFLERLDEVLEGRVMQRFGALLLGEPGDGKTRQEEDPEEVVIKRLQTGSRLREALGVPLTPQRVPTDGSVRTDVLKLFLEDERERLRIEKEHERESRKVKALEETKDMVKENIPDAVGALRDLARKSNQEATGGKGDTAPAGTEGATMSRGYVLLCDSCKKEFALPQHPARGESLTCPHCKAEVEVADGLVGGPEGAGQRVRGALRPPEGPAPPG
ncbi:MAG: hypothetical protein ABIF09_08290 [Gemmatimonadota bacterium]